jgi:hypothetical protein
VLSAFHHHQSQHPGMKHKNMTSTGSAVSCLWTLCTRCFSSCLPGTTRGPSQFLNDLWRLDLRTLTWQQLQPQGEAMPHISR